MGEALRGKGRQSPGLTLDPTAQRSPNKSSLAAEASQMSTALSHLRCDDDTETSAADAAVQEEKQDKSGILKAFRATFR